EERALAAARWPDDRDELVFFHGKRQLVDRHQRMLIGDKRLIQMSHIKKRHDPRWSASSLSARLRDDGAGPRRPGDIGTRSAGQGTFLYSASGKGSATTRR